jgi:hypothetical protein
MWSNILNNHDSFLLTSFLNEFSVSNCEFTSTIMSHPLPLIPPRVGVSEIVDMIVVGQVAMPDSISLLHNTKIHAVYNQPGSRIIASLRFQGTKLYDIAKSGECSLETKNEELVQQQAPKQLVSPVLREKPVEMSIEGLFTMVLDEMNRIKAFKMDCYLMSEKEIEVC